MFCTLCLKNSNDLRPMEQQHCDILEKIGNLVGLNCNDQWICSVCEEDIRMRQDNLELQMESNQINQFLDELQENLSDSPTKSSINLTMQQESKQLNELLSEIQDGLYKSPTMNSDRHREQVKIENVEIFFPQEILLNEVLETTSAENPTANSRIICKKVYTIDDDCTMDKDTHVCVEQDDSTESVTKEQFCFTNYNFSDHQPFKVSAFGTNCSDTSESENEFENNNEDNGCISSLKTTSELESNQLASTSWTSSNEFNNFTTLTSKRINLNSIIELNSNAATIPQSSENDSGMPARVAYFDGNRSIIDDDDDDHDSVIEDDDDANSSSTSQETATKEQFSFTNYKFSDQPFKISAFGANCSDTSESENEFEDSYNDNGSISSLMPDSAANLNIERHALASTNTNSSSNEFNNFTTLTSQGVNLNSIVELITDSENNSRMPTRALNRYQSTASDIMPPEILATAGNSAEINRNCENDSRMRTRAMNRNQSTASDSMPQEISATVGNSVELNRNCENDSRMPTRALNRYQSTASDSMPQEISAELNRNYETDSRMRTKATNKNQRTSNDVSQKISLTVCNSRSSNKQRRLTTANKISKLQNRNIFKYKNAYCKIGTLYVCKLCTNSKKFLEKTFVRQHILHQHLNLRFQCPECKQNIVNIGLLRDHCAERHDLYVLADPKRLLFKKSEKPVKKISTKSEKFSKKITKKRKINTRNNAPNKTRQSDEATTTKPLVQQSMKPGIQSAIAKFYNKVNRYYYCNECADSSYKYCSLQSVKNHIKVKHMGYRYICTECDKRVANLQNIKLHYQRAHNIANGIILFEIPEGKNPHDPSSKFSKAIEKVGNSYHCLICTETPKYKYANEMYLTLHIRLYHYGYRYICTKCDDAEYTNSGALKNHYSKVHNKKDGMIKFDIPKNRDNIFNKSLKKFQHGYKKINENYHCQLCTESEKKFTVPSGAVAHIKSFHFGFRYACKKCFNIKYVDKKNLRKHCANQHSKNSYENLELIKILNKAAYEDFMAKRLVYSTNNEDYQPEDEEVSPNSIQNVEKSIKNAGKSIQKADNSIQNANKSVENVDTSIQNTDKSIQKAAKSNRLADKSTQNTEKFIQDAEKSIHNAYKSIQNVDKSIQIADKSKSTNFGQKNKSKISAANLIEISAKSVQNAGKYKLAANCVQKDKSTASLDVFAKSVQNTAIKNNRELSKKDNSNFIVEEVVTQQPAAATTNTSKCNSSSSYTKNPKDFKKYYQKDGKIFRCKLCSKSKKFSKISIVKEHIEFEHFKLGYHLCNECDRIFESEARLEKHYNRRHNMKQPLKLKIIVSEKAGSKDKKQTGKESQNSIDDDDEAPEENLKNRISSNNKSITKNQKSNSFQNQNTKNPTNSAWPLQQQNTMSNTATTTPQNNSKQPILNVKVKLLSLNGWLKPSKKAEQENSTSPKKNQSRQAVKIATNSTTLNSKETISNQPSSAGANTTQPQQNSTSSQLSLNQIDSTTSPETSSASNKFAIAKPLFLYNKLTFKSYYKKIGDLYCCALCSHKCTSARGSGAHIKFHHFDYRYCCNYCDATYTESFRLQRHYRNVHNEDNGPIIYQAPKSKQIEEITEINKKK